MVLPGGDGPAELVVGAQASLRHGLTDPARVAKAAADAEARERRRLRRAQRRRWVAKLKRAVTDPS